MIKANELRIGNLVSDIWNPDLMKQIISLGKNQCIYGNLRCKYDKLIPIQITEPLLIKLGFDKKHNGEFINNGYVITFSTFGYPHFWISEFSDIIISSIHELQNLYFALTGSELIFSTEP